MTGRPFYDESLGVRADLDDAHARVWAGVAAVGGWFSASERRSLAAVVVVAFLDAEPLAPWLALTGDASRVDHVAELLGAPHDLDPAVADAAYRMTATAASLGEAWVGSMMDAITPDAYVEMCGIVTSVSAVCSFARSIGARLPGLPPVSSSAAPQRVAVAHDRSPRNWVPVSPTGGSRASVIEALSIAPGEYDLLWSYLAPAQYMSNEQMADLAFTRGTVSRPQAELLAGRVAALRQCFF